jgi:hypothetical protein
MKKLIAIMLTVGLFAAVPGSASAGGRGGYSSRGGYYGHGGYGVGGFFAGLLGGAILGTVLSHSYEPVYAAPAPRAYYYAPPPEQVWVPGRYETRNERQWVPGHWEVERYSGHGEDEDDGYSRGRRGWIPGRYEEVRTRVWLPGHWEERG